MSSPGVNVSAPARARTRETRLPTSLRIVWGVLCLPVLLSLVVVVGTAAANVATSMGPQLIVGALPWVAAFCAAVATTAAARHVKSPTGSAALAMTTAFLLLAAAAPLLHGLLAAFTEEWCEGQPGGRGSTGYRTEAEVPPVCR